MVFYRGRTRFEPCRLRILDEVALVPLAYAIARALRDRVLRCVTG
jgi:hypothetical protein